MAPESSLYIETDSTDGSSLGRQIDLDDIPSQEDIEIIQDLLLQDFNGKEVQFRSIFTGFNCPRRVLVIFIGHFLNPYSQEYVRTLSLSIAYSSLILLPVSTTIVFVGCGSASLIPMFKAETGCHFLTFADPQGELHLELGMICTSNLGLRPDYQRNSMAANIWKGIKQSLRLRKESNALHCGDRNQAGGEFLFEPLEIDTPCPSLVSADVKVARLVVGFRAPRTPVDGEDKMVSWCYRMRHIRDHVELPELREVLGLKGNGGPGNHPKRWERALRERKGMGESWMRHMERWHIDSYLTHSD